MQNKSIRPKTNFWRKIQMYVSEKEHGTDYKTKKLVNNDFTI